MRGILAVLILAATTPQTSANTVLSLVNLEDCSGGGPKSVVGSRCEWGPSLRGKGLAQILREEGPPVIIDEAVELTDHGVLLDGDMTGARRGRVLRKTPSRPSRPYHQ